MFKWKEPEFNIKSTTVKKMFDKSQHVINGGLNDHYSIIEEGDPNRIKYVDFKLDARCVRRNGENVVIEMGMDIEPTYKEEQKNEV